LCSDVKSIPEWPEIATVAVGRVASFTVELALPPSATVSEVGENTSAALDFVAVK